MKIQSTITIMMFTQVFLLLFCNIASGIQKVYTTITGNDYKSPERRAIETAIFQTVFLINYIGAGLPFYMYTLTGAVFRQALFRLIYMIFHCNRARQEVAPSQGSN
ncbi:hypothetical protein I4U23_022909 [Adineta vaga]|nr:hypothetical protein I4U23_022909 [Adineta vaga]